MISDKLKNALNKLSPHLGNLHFGTVLAGISAQGDTADATAAKLAEMQSYSETPKQIGTWIDGSPVYRKAFDVLLKEMPEAEYADILSNSVFTVSTVIGSIAAYLTSAFCAYDDGADSLYHCGIENLNGFLIDFGVPDAVTIPEDQSDCTDERYYGYIDFIKPGDAS